MGESVGGGYGDREGAYRLSLKELKEMTGSITLDAQTVNE